MAETTEQRSAIAGTVLGPVGWSDIPPAATNLGAGTPVIKIERAIDLRAVRRGTRIPTAVVAGLLAAVSMAATAQLVRPATGAAFELPLRTDIPQAGLVLPAKGASDDLARAADRLLSAGPFELHYRRALNGAPYLAVNGNVDQATQRANLTVEKNDGTTHHLDLRQINGETFAKSSEPASFLTGKAKANIWSALADKRGESLRQLSGGTLGWEGVVKLLGFVPPTSIHAKTGRDEGGNTLVTGLVDLALVPLDDHRYDELRVIGAGRLPFEATLDGSGRPVTITVNVPGAGTFTVQAVKIGEPFELVPPAVG